MATRAARQRTRPDTFWRAPLNTLVRKLITIAGAALVTRGYVTQDLADGWMPIVVEQVLGFVLVFGATGCSLARAHHASRTPASPPPGARCSETRHQRPKGPAPPR